MQLQLRATVFLVVSVAAFPAAAQGYFSGWNGAHAAARAGAFTAKADDISAVNYNPAGLANTTATTIQIGNRFTYNSYAYTRSPTTDWGYNHDTNGQYPVVQFDQVNNGAPWQLLDPMLGVASNLGLKNWGFALAAFAPAGIGKLDFPVGGGQRYMMVSRDTQIITYNASAAWKFGELFGLGATLQWISVPKMRYRLVVDGNTFGGRAYPVWSDLDMLADVSASSLFTLNAILGGWFRPVPFLEWGISGQIIPTQIRMNGTLNVQALSSTITEPVVLKRKGAEANDITITLPLPTTIRNGIRYRHLQAGRELFDIELDVSYEFWSRVPRFTVESNGLTATLRNQDVGIGRIDLQKQWRDTITVSLGGDYILDPKSLILRGGLFYTSPVADPAYANVDFVGGPQLGGAIGASLLFGKIELAVAYDYRTQLPVSVTEDQSRVYQQVPGSLCKAPYTDTNTCNEHYLGRPAPPVNAGSYRAYSHAATLDLFYRFL